MNELYSWHTAQWQGLIERQQASQLPHALLLTGPRGVGKAHFSHLLARSLLCSETNSQALACGRCRACQLLNAHTHPDIRILEPIEAGKVIGVDQVRGIIHYLSLTSQSGGYKLVIISPADQMNINAANSLLKTLEEPPASTLLILVTDRPALLPATIRSRCQSIRFSKPSQSHAIEWLNQRINTDQTLETLLSLAEGAPLIALGLADGQWLDNRTQVLEDLEKLTNNQSDPVLIAEKWLKLDIKQTLYWMYSWLVDMVRISMVSQPPQLSNLDIRQQLAKMANGLSPTQLFGRLDRVTKAIQVIDRPINGQLLIEDLLIGWRRSNKFQVSSDKIKHQIPSPL